MNEQDLHVVDGTKNLTVTDGISRLLSLGAAPIPNSDAASAEEPEAEAPETATDVDETDPADQAADDPDSEADEDAAADAEATEEHGEIFRVKANGQWHEVTLDELKRGYSRTADYSRDKNALKQDRDAFLAERDATRTLRTEYTERLTQLDAALTAIQPSEADLEQIRAEDPDRFGEAYQEYTARKKALETITAERERQAATAAEDAQAEAKAFVAEQAARLTDRIPEAGDPEQKAPWWHGVVAYADEHLGLDPALTNTIAHAGLVEAIDKARRYDALMAHKDTVTTKRRRTRAAKPGASKTEAPRKPAKDARARLAQSGRTQDAVATLLAIRKGS